MDGGYQARNGAKDAPIIRQQQQAGSLHHGDDFPILCETCLGGNPYVRMVKLPFGQKLCKISTAPYQAFRWKAGPGGRYKETIISYQVAQQRNICQTCLNDMQFGLPVGVRDKLLSKMKDQPNLPESDVGTRYFYEQQSQLVEQNSGAPNISEEMNNIGASRQLTRFSRILQVAKSKNKTAFRNLPKLCSFWVAGACVRVVKKSCPFRPCCGSYVFPELAATHRELCAALIKLLNDEGPVKAQRLMDKETRVALKDSQKGNKDDAIKKRVHGEDDLSRKYLGKMKNMNLELPAPEDPTVCTLWVGNLEQDITESDLYNAFFPYGFVNGIHMLRHAKCAFVEMGDRAAAEHASKQLYGALMVRGRALSLQWARPRLLGSDSGNGGPPIDSSAMLPPPGLEDAPMNAYSLPGLSPPTAVPPPPPPPPPLPPGPRPIPQNQFQEQNNVSQLEGEEVEDGPVRKRAALALRPSENSLLPPDEAIHPPGDTSAHTLATPTGPQRESFVGDSARRQLSSAPHPRVTHYPSMDPARMGANFGV